MMEGAGLPEDMVTLSHGRAIPRAIYPRFRFWLRFVLFSMLMPFLYLALASPFSTADLLAAATFVHDTAWMEVKSNPLLGCTDRCWARYYILIATAITWIAMPVLCALAIPTALEHVRLGRETIRRGGDPYAKLPVGFTIERISSFGQAVRIVFGIVFYSGALWFFLAHIPSAAGANWVRRGVSAPPLYMAMGFSFMLGLMQFFATALTSFIVFALISIARPFDRRKRGCQGRRPARAG
ncbi:MAG: hypothetical protein ACOY4R_22395 [Pseudomonadota bacterium]